MIGRVIAGSLLFVSSLAIAGPPLQPTSKWAVDFGDSHCVATRNYGTDSDPLYLVLKQPPLGKVLQLGIVRKGGAETQQVDGDILFDGTSPIPASFLEYSTNGQRALLANLPLANLWQMKMASTLHLRARLTGPQRLGTLIPEPGSSTEVTLALTQVQDLMKVMDSCVDGLRKLWNVTPAADEVSSERKDLGGNLRSLFNSGDYPAQALLNGKSGAVKVALLVNESGKVADCSVIETSGQAALDAQSCAILKKGAQFKPAIGPDGKPAKTAWVQKIVWGIVG